MGGAGAPSKSDIKSFEELECYLSEIYKNININQILNTINSDELYGNTSNE